MSTTGRAEVPLMQELTDSASIEAIIARALGTSLGSEIVVDLSAINHMTMEAAVPLARFARRCSADGRSLRVVASQPVRRKLETMGLGAVILLESRPRAD